MMTEFSFFVTNYPFKICYEACTWLVYQQQRATLHKSTKAQKTSTSYSIPVVSFRPFTQTQSDSCSRNNLTLQGSNKQLHPLAFLLRGTPPLYLSLSHTHIHTYWEWVDDRMSRKRWPYTDRQRKRERDRQSERDNPALTVSAHTERRQTTELLLWSFHTVLWKYFWKAKLLSVTLPWGHFCFLFK